MIPQSCCQFARRLISSRLPKSPQVIAGVAFLASAPGMPRCTSTGGSISALRNLTCLSYTSTFAHPGRFLPSFQIQPSSNPNQVYSRTCPANIRHHGTPTDRWNLLSLNRPSCRPFSQSSNMVTHDAAATGFMKRETPSPELSLQQRPPWAFRRFQSRGESLHRKRWSIRIGAQSRRSLGGSCLNRSAQHSVPPSHHELT